MSYWSAKKNLEFVQSYRNTVIQYWNVEDEIESIVNQSPFSRHMMPQEEGQKITKATEKHRREWAGIRETIAKNNPRMNNVASSLSVPMIVTSFPAPAVGGYTVKFPIFDAILRDPSHGAVIGEGIDRQAIMDAINATIGRCEEQVQTEWNHLINPLYWIKALFIFLLRLPVNLVGLAGFNVSEFEKYFWAKLFNLLWIVAMISFLLWLGLGKADLIEVIKKIITKE